MLAQQGDFVKSVPNEIIQIGSFIQLQVKLFLKASIKQQLVNANHMVTVEKQCFHVSNLEQ